MDSSDDVEENWLLFAVSNAKMEWRHAFESESSAFRSEAELRLTAKCYSYVEHLETFINIERNSELLVSPMAPTDRATYVGHVYAPYRASGALQADLFLPLEHFLSLCSIVPTGGRVIVSLKPATSILSWDGTSTLFLEEVNIDSRTFQFESPLAPHD